MLKASFSCRHSAHLTPLWRLSQQGRLENALCGEPHSSPNAEVSQGCQGSSLGAGACGGTQFRGIADEWVQLDMKYLITQPLSSQAIPD